MTQTPERRRSPRVYTEVVDRARIVRNPLVSAVMITYNHEPYIAQAIEGVLSQEADFPIELVIGEDCSTDRTREIVLDYQRRYPEIIRVIYSPKNVGMQANALRTNLAARGKYTAFCEGDDWWHRRDKLQVQISYFRSCNSLVCLSGRVRHVTAQGEPIETGKHTQEPEAPVRLKYQDLFFDFVQLPCTLVARTDAVRRALLGDTLCSDHSQLMGDTPLCIELSQLGEMIHLNEELATYRHSPNSACRQSDPLHTWRFAKSALDIRYRALERYPLPGPANRTWELKADFIRRALLAAVWLGDSNLARKQIERLRSIGARVGWKETAFRALASVPMPRRLLTRGYRKVRPYLRTMGIDLVRLIIGCPRSRAAWQRVTSR